MFRCPILRTRIPLEECVECEWADRCQTLRSADPDDLKQFEGQGTEAFKSIRTRILEGTASPTAASAIIPAVADDEPDPETQPEGPPMPDEATTKAEEDDTSSEPELTPEEEAKRARTAAATEARLARYRERKLAGMLIMVETKKESGLFKLAEEDTPAGELLLARNEGRRVITTFEYHEL